jgi:hypothetical protein
MLGGGEYNRMTRSPTYGARPLGQLMNANTDFDVFS